MQLVLAELGLERGGGGVAGGGGEGDELAIGGDGVFFAVGGGDQLGEALAAEEETLVDGGEHAVGVDAGELGGEARVEDRGVGCRAGGEGGEEIVGGAAELQGGAVGWLRGRDGAAREKAAGGGGEGLEAGGLAGGAAGVVGEGEAEDGVGERVLWGLAEGGGEKRAQLGGALHGGGDGVGDEGGKPDCEKGKDGAHAEDVDRGGLRLEVPALMRGAVGKCDSGDAFRA